jgi:hypothetical protein
MLFLVIGLIFPLQQLTYATVFALKFVSVCTLCGPALFSEDLVENF